MSQIFQRSNKIIVRISALDSEMGQIQKIKALYFIKWYTITNLHDNMPLSFLFDPFLEARAEILFGKFKTPQFSDVI